MKKIVCFGEVLWDVFPTHKKIGGAPLNVAVRLQSIGNDVTMISKVGADENGKEIIEFIRSNKVNSDYIEVDDIFKTGSVKVLLDDKGSATYDIEYPRAWDKIQSNPEVEKLVEGCDALYYGSLAIRDEVSKHTLFNLIEKAKFKICDLNLRPPHYAIESLVKLMKSADFIKLNDDELYEVAEKMGSKYHSLEQNIQFIAEETKTSNVCITLGSHGAVLLYKNVLYYNCGYKIKVVDTVGAGDSFFATLISKLLNGDNPQESINYACAVGALVAGSKGANPKIPIDEIEKFVNPEN